MKKILILVLFMFSLFSINANAIEFQKPKQFVQASYSYDVEKGYEHDMSFFSAEYEANWQTVKASSGMQFSSDVYDFTIFADWFPKRFIHEKETLSYTFGFGGIYHLQSQFDIAIEHDILSQAFFKLFTKNDFSMKFLLGYGGKITNIYAIPSSKGILWTHNLIGGFFIDKKWKNGWEVHFSSKNFDFYRYYIADSLVYTLGGSYTHKEKYKFTGDFEIKFLDQIISTPYINGLLFKFSVGYFF